MWLMLRQPHGDDYVLATGESATVRDFCAAAFAHADLDWEHHVAIDARYERPAEVEALVGDATKAREKLGWQPQLRWREIAQVMVDADIRQLDDELSGRSVRIDQHI